MGHLLAPVVLNHSLDMGLPFISKHALGRDQVIAIDLGARTTKAVHLQRRHDKFCLTNWAVVDSPIFDKSITAELLADHIKNVTRSLGGKYKQVTLALGVNEAIFRQVEAPLVPVPDLRLMMKFNSKTYLQQELPDFVFDCQFGVFSLVGKNGEAARTAASAPKQKVMVGGARKQLLDDVQAAFRLAGLVVDHVVPGAVGPVNAYELSEPESFSKDVLALVELGFKYSTITILDAGEIMLHRVVAIGGDRLTHGLAESLGISYQEAENIKLGMPGEVASDLEPLIHPLGRELRATIDFFENHHDKAVSKVLLSGGSSRSELIVQALQAEMMVACELWLPTKNFEIALPVEKQGDFESTAPQLTVAIGAAAASF
jgi:type IV pilus assembly protein PilM